MNASAVPEYAPYSRGDARSGGGGLPARGLAPGWGRLITAWVGLFAGWSAHGGAPWEEMDYGPFLTASIEAPSARTNIAYKGIALRLGGDGARSGMLFDTDLLRFSAGWSGPFMELKGVVFDGEHWAYPRVGARPDFLNGMGPGWARPGTVDFGDPRSQPFGPLPRSWAHWEGLYLHGSNVVLSYRVGDMPVLELAGAELRAGGRAYERTLNLGPSTTRQVVQVLEEPGRMPGVRRWSAAGAEGQAEPGVVGAPGTAIWLEAPMIKEAQGKRRGAPTDGLWGHWNFEGTGESAWQDRSGRGREFGRQAGVEIGEGKSGGGVKFAGEAPVEIGGAAEFDPRRQDLTFAAWILTGEDGTIFAKTAPGSVWVPGGAALFVSGGRLTFDVGWVGAVSGQTTVADGAWHHVAWTWRRETGTARLYVDGVSDGVASLKPARDLAGHVLRLGFAAPNFPAKPGFRGRMDDVRFYDRALAAEEVEALVGAVPRDETVPAVAVVGAMAGARWLTGGTAGWVRLEMPPHAEPVRLKVVTWRGPAARLDDFLQALREVGPAEDLAPRTRGGPARWAERPVTQGRPGRDEGPYAVDELTAPDSNPWKSWLRFGAVDFFADGRRAAISTWNGDVWVVEGVDGSLAKLTWQRVATGLFQPLGLKIVDDAIYVLGRDQITRLHDLNGDGEADFYENFNNDGLVSEHFHEFATDLKLGPDGAFYYIKCARHALPALHAQHGSLLRVTRDGSRLDVVARGFRAVNGLGVGPRGEFTTIDNQGHWMPANRLNWVKPGGWYGNQWAWNPDQRTSYDEPLCWMHNFVDRSGGTQLWVPDNRWGPLADRLITMSYGMGHQFLVLKEEVEGVVQGAVTRFPLDFETGVMRGVFHPGNGQLYGCGLYGWAGNKTRAGGFYRIRYTGRPLDMATRWEAVRDGMILGFSDPLDPAGATDPGNYDAKAWNYRWSAQYGSPDFRLDGREGRDTWRVESATLSADGRSVFLRVPEVQRVMQVHVVFRLKTVGGRPVENFVHGTIHRVARDAGMARIGPGAVERSVAARDGLRLETPGLRQNLFLADETDPREVRKSRLAALYVPRGTAAGVFVPAGRVRSRWEGRLKMDLNTEEVFEVEGRGTARLRINGVQVLEAKGDPWRDARSARVSLSRGLNRFELDYEAPAAGDAELRLLWRGSGHPVEPVPPTAFVFDGEDGSLVGFDELRRGRSLFAERQCGSCHRAPLAWSAEGMPELLARAPTLDRLGERVNAGWLAEWLTQPRATRPDARMPRLLAGETAEKDRADVVAFFMADRETASTTPAGEPGAGDAGVLSAGGKLYSDLGCAGCHWLPGDPGLKPETRVGLGNVGTKLNPKALAAYLRSPTRNHAATRMPDFALTDGEARALSAWLIDRGGAAGAPKSVPPAGDAGRGGELVARLGCLRCHDRAGVADRSAAPEFVEITRADGRRGCLADFEADRGGAPAHDLSADERRQLRVFLRHDAEDSLRRDSPVDFAERQYRSLRCQACHPRDTETDVLASLAGPGKASEAEEGGEGGSVHVGRPPLTFTGEKLYSGWVERFLAGRLPYKPRSDLQGRMPAFPAYARGLAEGMAHAHGYRAESAPAPADADLDASVVGTGQALTRVEGGFSCVSCHGIGDQKALAGKDTATVNFAYVAERLRPSYYWRYVQDPPRVMPGTMMPKFIGDDGRTSIKAVFDGDPERQFQAVWKYLESVRTR